MARRKYPRIVVVGSVNMDLVAAVQRFPDPGETVSGGNLQAIAGGKGANQAVAASRAGAEVDFVGAVGDDTFGPKLIAGLEREGIGVAHVKVVPGTASGIALIAVKPDGENTLIHAPGANGSVDPALVRQATTCLAAADCLLLQREIPHRAVEAALNAARRNDLLTVLNPAPAGPLPRALLAKVDVLILNETEAETLTKTRVRDLRQARTCTAELASAVGGQCAILTLGKRGAWVSAPGSGRPVQIPALQVRAIDTTAAGDTFVGALSTRFLETGEIVEAARFATAAAALAVTQSGAQPSIPSRRAILRCLREARK